VVDGFGVGKERGHMGIWPYILHTFSVKVWRIIYIIIAMYGLTQFISYDCYLTNS